MALTSDDGRLLLEDDPPGLTSFLGWRDPKHIGPRDVVGHYEAETFISVQELSCLIDARRNCDAIIVSQDRADLEIPYENIIAGVHIYLPFGPSSPAELIWRYLDGIHENMIRAAAAELAVRRDLRNKRIGIKLD